MPSLHASPQMLGSQLVRKKKSETGLLLALIVASSLFHSCGDIYFALYIGFIGFQMGIVLK